MFIENVQVYLKIIFLPRVLRWKIIALIFGIKATTTPQKVDSVNLINIRQKDEDELLMTAMRKFQRREGCCMW